MPPVRSLWIACRDQLDRGGQVNLVRLLEQLDPRRHQIRVLVPGRGPLFQRLCEQGIDCRSIAVPYRRKPGKRLSWRQRLACLRPFVSIQAYRPHLVCVDAVTQLPVARTLAWGTGARLLWHAQATPTTAHGIRHADQVIAVAPHLAARIRQLAPGTPVDCVPNAVDGDRFCPGDDPALRAELGAGADDPVILHVGALERSKGVDDLIEAFAQVAATHPRAWLWLAGAGSKEEALRALVAAHGLEARTRFLGVRGDIERCYRAATLFVLASHGEGMPLSLLEAMASSRACLVTDIPATRDLLPPDAGRRVPVHSPEGLAHEMLALVAAPAQRDSLGAAARQHVLAAHGYAAHIQAFAACLLRLAGRAP